MNPLVESFFDSVTSTGTHVVHTGPGSEAAIIDSVLDFDLKTGRTGHVSADRVEAYVRDHGLRVAWHLETHVHADHLSAAPLLRSRLGGRIGIGKRVLEVQERFGKVFNYG